MQNKCNWALNCCRGPRDEDFPGSSVVENPSANAGHRGSIPGSESSPGGGNNNPLQYFCSENPMDREAW